MLAEAGLSLRSGSRLRWLTAGVSIRGVNLEERHAARGEDIGDFGRSRAVRREAALALSMSQRLARLHTLCKQMSAVKGAAQTR